MKDSIKIKCVRVRTDPYTGRCIMAIAPVDPQRSIDETLSDREIIIEKQLQGGDYTLRLLRSVANPSFYGFELEQNIDNYLENKGHIWSSRTTLVNREFGVKLIEVEYVSRNMTPLCAIDVETAKEILPPGYEIAKGVFNPDDPEPIYYIKRKEAK